MKPLIQVKRLRPGVRLPTRATAAASGLDLYADIDTVCGLREIPTAIPTGIAAQAPSGYELQIRPRSGQILAGLQIGWGTIDADYRGELIVMAWTTAAGGCAVIPGQRIAQLVCAPVLITDIIEVPQLDETERGSGGLGSTGL